MKRRACMIRVDFHPRIANSISGYCMRCSAGKQEILRFLESLVARGYRHFILHIEQPSDVWVADLLSRFQKTSKEVLVYSIGIWQYDQDPCEWIEELPFDWEAITSNAHRLFWRNKDWYDNGYRVERLYISVGEKWYDAHDRCARMGD